MRENFLFFHTVEYLLDPVPSILTLQLEPVFSILRQCLSVYSHLIGSLLVTSTESEASSVTISIGDCRLPSSATGNSLCHVKGPNSDQIGFGLRNEMMMQKIGYFWSDGLFCWHYVKSHNKLNNESCTGGSK